MTRKTVLAFALAAACLTAPAAAQADSIVYVKDHNLWLANPDGSGQYQVTGDGTADRAYGSPSQADDGTIVARKGTDIVRMRQNGELLSSFDPPDTTDSAGQWIGGVPVDVAVSPDGSRVAYSYYTYNCPPGVSCGARYVTLYSSAAAATPETTYGKLFRNSPSWVSNDRVLVFGGAMSQVNYDSPGGGTDDDVHWFDDIDMFAPPTDLGDGELSRQGDRLVTIRSYGADSHLMFYKVGSLGSLPAYACNTGAEETLDGPSWSPDGAKVAFAHRDGIEVLPLPSVEAGCPGAGSGTVVLPGGSQPDWGPAAVNPGPRTGPVVTPPETKSPDTKTPAAKRKASVAKCKTIAKKRKRARCIKKARAVAKCKRSKQGKARARCIAKAKRRFA